jgi:hypothetical protein
LNFKAIRNENAKLGLLEFSGRGTESLKEAMAEKMSVMASIGGSLVQKQRKQVESAETARIRTASETSALETICDTIEQASEQMLGYVSKWMGWSEEIEVSLNRDFTNERWDPADIKAITEAEMMGVISKETAFYQRKLLEFYPDKRTQTLKETLSPRLIQRLKPNNMQLTTTTISWPKRNEHSH